MLDDIFTQALQRWQAGPLASGGATRSSTDCALDSYTYYLQTVARDLQARAAQRGGRVCVYPAGRHTRWLLSVVGEVPGTDSWLLLDDNPSAGELAGRAVQRAAEAALQTRDVLLISTDTCEAQLARQAQHFVATSGADVPVVRLYEGLPPGPYAPPPTLDELALRQAAIQMARWRWATSDFVGPCEQAGVVPDFLREQWLWSQRARIRGHVLDMSTPRHWHRWVHELPQVDRVSISNLEGPWVMKGWYASRVDVIADFCAADPPTAVGSFDTVLCCSVMEHVAEPAMLLRNLHHALTPGGTLLLTVPFAGATDGHCEPDLWRFTQAGLHRLAERAGYTEIATGGQGDLGADLAAVLGGDHSAAGPHHGIPIQNWLQAIKPR